MALQTVQDLFVRDLRDMYDCEQRVGQMLQQFVNEVDNPQLKQGLEQHYRETQQHVKNIEQCFQILGQQPTRGSCLAIEGLKQEHDAYMKENPAPPIVAMIDLGSALKTEHYEVASYVRLIEECAVMGENECARLLQQNLQQEQAMAQRVLALSQEIGKQMVGQMGRQAQQAPRVQP